MIQNLSPVDIEKLREIREIRKQNNDVGWMLCDYLNNAPCFVTKELIEHVNVDWILPEETVFLALLEGWCGLDPETNEYHRLLVNNYLRRAVKQLDVKLYTENPYYRNIKIPNVKFGNWELIYQKFEPYEAFVYKDLIVDADFKEFPCIGFFNQEFRFPSVLENGHEWMAIKPSEIETIQPVVDEVEGDVVTFGLGLGYFAYMASNKSNVQHVTVVERDVEVIRLFNQYIFPQFKHKEKVEIIEADAFEYAEKRMPAEKFDYAFVDLWHDVSDGLELYLGMKKLESLSFPTRFLYWVENSLLSRFRYNIFDWVVANARSYDEIVSSLSFPTLRKLATVKTLAVSD